MPHLEFLLAFFSPFLQLPAMLSDHPQQPFSVVGIIGKDGVGKSTILSWIAKHEGNSPFFEIMITECSSE
jgi:hypothetical protein